MTASNHVITGMVLLAAVPHPAMLPAAFMTHFILDALPHFGERNNEIEALGRLKFILPVDAGIALSFLTVVFILQPANWLLIMAGGVLCASPDLLQIPRYIRFLRTGDASPDNNWFARFHHRIQWGERLWGIWIELAWVVLFFWLFLSVA